MALIIAKLPTNVICRIRSELAITSVAQCVEELVLNALDSKCLNVAVRLDLDIFKIIVVDDGGGISEDGLNIIGTRYATSKCSSVEDLETNLKHFGYRGEALASIISTAAIVEIISRERAGGETFSKVFLYGKSNSASATRSTRPSLGTTISVTDFMYNLPVRRKLIKPSFDVESCRERLERIALVHPQVSFSLTTDKNKCTVMKTRRTISSVGVFSQLYGPHMKDDLCEVDYFATPFNIRGFISKRPYHSKSLQLIYVNSRPVINKKIVSLVNNLLSRSLIMARKCSPSSAISPSMSPTHLAKQHCLFLINIECPFDEYDITFEPKKSLVEFSNVDQLLHAIEIALLSFLEREKLTICEEKISRKGDDSSAMEQLQIAEVRLLSKQISKHKLSAFASKNRISASDVGYMESLPARRKTASIETPGDNEVLTHANVTAESEVRSELAVKPKSSLQMLRDVVKEDTRWSSVPTHKQQQPKSQSSLDAFKRAYFEGSRLLDCNQSTSKPICSAHARSPLYNIKIGEKRNSLGFNQLKNTFGSTRNPVPSENTKRIEKLPKNYDMRDHRINDKSFYFSPQLNSSSLMKSPTTKATLELYDLNETSIYEGIICSNEGSNNNQCMETNNNFDTISTTLSDHFDPDYVRSVRNNNAKCVGSDITHNGRSPKQSFIYDYDPESRPCVVEANLVDNNAAKDLNNLTDALPTEKTVDYEVVSGENGREIYINKDTGNSSYVQPLRQEDQLWKKNRHMGAKVLSVPLSRHEGFCKKFSVSHGYMPNNVKRKHAVDSIVSKCLKPASSTAENVLKESSSSSHPCMKEQLNCEDILNKWKENELLLAQRALQSDGYDQALEHPMTTSSIPCYKISQPYKLDRDILQQAKVIGQLDKKFIVITVPYKDCPTDSPTDHNLLVLLDQHAADERVQLERKLDDNYDSNDGKETVRWSVVDPPFRLEFQPREVALLTAYEEVFEGFGLYYAQIEETVVEFTAIPSILVPTENSERQTRRCQLANQIVEATVNAICDTISTLRGSSTDFTVRRPLPPPLAYIFNTFACKAAIKFGDLLTLEESRSLVRSLGKCRLPFQCAHGRPSAYPVMEFRHLLSNPHQSGSKPNLTKIRKLIQ